MSLPRLVTPGTRVVFTANGRGWEKDFAKEHLRVGNEYTIANTRKGSSTLWVTLNNLKGLEFKSTLFIERSRLQESNTTPS